MKSLHDLRLFLLSLVAEQCQWHADYVAVHSLFKQATAEASS